MKEKLNRFIKDKLDALRLKDVRFEKVQVKSNHLVIYINGGENGLGNWTDYVKQIDFIVHAFDNSYIVDITNDCLDDLWQLRLGWRMNAEIVSLLPFDLSSFAEKHAGEWVIKIDDEDFIYCNNGDLMFRQNEDSILNLIQDINVGEAKEISTGTVVTVYVEDNGFVDVLPIESSVELFRLGVPYHFATVPYIYEAPYRTAGIGMSKVFSLSNLLNILPTTRNVTINGESTRAILFMRSNSSSVENKMDTWSVGYETVLKIGETTPRLIVMCSARHLINALSELVKWCVQTKTITFPTQKETLTSSTTIV